MSPKTSIGICPKCNGTGKAEIRPELEETLQRLKRLRKPVTSFGLREEGITHGAICNRLNDLERLGLVERSGKSPDNKSIMWVAVKPQKQAKP